MVTTTNLEGYWKCDESSGDIIDAHGSNDGSYNGSLYSQTGKINTAIGFDGTDDVIDLTTKINLTGDFSINIWLNPGSNFALNWGAVFGETGGDCRAFIRDTTQMRVQYDGNSYDFTMASHSGTYKMYTLVRDGTDLILYTNASSETINSVSTSTFSVDNFGLGIATYFIDGELDELAIWSRALSSTEVTDLYNSGSGLAYPFVTDVTVNPSAVSLSLTNQSPSYFIDITKGPVNLNVSSLSVQTTGAPRANMGTVGTREIATIYPVEEGLQARTTKQTGNPNLEPQEERTRF